MKTVKFVKDNPGEGLCAGDVLEVDDNSAAALIRRGEAEEYNPQAVDAVRVAEPRTFGDQEGVRTMDDIRDPQAARNRRVMSFTTVAAPDPGPAVAEAADESVSAPQPAAKPRTRPAQAASDAQSAGGDAGGGNA
ncbi:tail assembly chaperone [Mycobacterium phage Evanesce]|uniref:Uncharacterized protein n=12 Tax=Caudoviricetes TaxID=2731619 RepID=A0A8T8JBC1_9CAUD|nr:virion protein [Mycobacterium phage Giles]AHY84201.1 tail assembly chaperone [Mycobacterium phage HH92]ALA06660.1 hypothetical protein SEA_OBUpride_16 [Mycobacterium phage OBUpride]ALF00237.1 tail assembly chaperone [Mycobacterium phage Evanesce]ATN90415.1 hypothetical protein SEA_LILHAZELNUT_16 [Mycobacterium phage LilHazelnut]QDH48756.1 hypothetical protein SEA_DEEPSOIL15_16 [Mycobacterium phage DeepSoil15]QIQ62635.1 hypothetical protein SEA_EIN37_16 [Mycobacterium phage Ein37]QNL29784.